MVVYWVSPHSFTSFVLHHFFTHPSGSYDMDEGSGSQLESTETYVKYLRRKLKSSLKEEQKLLKRNMELLLMRRDLKAKCEKMEVEETIALMWRQKESLDKTIVEVNSGSFGAEKLQQQLASAVAGGGGGGGGGGNGSQHHRHQHLRRMSLQNGSSHGPNEVPLCPPEEPHAHGGGVMHRRPSLY